jgi:hypothetical protein
VKSERTVNDRPEILGLLKDLISKNLKNHFGILNLFVIVVLALVIAFRNGLSLIKLPFTSELRI